MYKGIGITKLSRKPEIFSMSLTPHSKYTATVRFNYLGELKKKKIKLKIKL